MEIKRIYENKKEFLELLLLADEQEDMIDKYLDRGDLFALYDGDLKTVCVVTKESDNIFEIKNLATYEKYQARGYGKGMLEYIFSYYKKYGGNKIIVGTGESRHTLGFYESCGFKISHRIKNFFVDNYDHPIFEEGVKLIDMIYLERNL